MTTEQQIEMQLNEEQQRFENGVYKGKVAIPVNIFDLFKKGVLALAPQFHSVLSSRIKMIVSKEISNLTISDLFLLIKIIVNTPLHILHGNNFDTATDAQMKFEKFVLSYNEYVEVFKQSLKEKRERLINLSSGKTNGMRIIPSKGQA